MTSTSEGRIVFLDADVLAHPLTRSMLLFASRHRTSGFVPRWSLAAEGEADRALKAQWEHMVAKPGGSEHRPVNVSQLRESHAASDWADQVIVAPATDAGVETLIDTSPTDKHILAAAYGAGASVVVSYNVRDFGRGDLERLGMSVAHPDVFLAAVIPVPVYRVTLEELASVRSRDPKTPEAIHQRIGRTLPRLAKAMSGEFPGIEPDPPENIPAEVFRGARCLVCGARLNDPESLAVGVGPECR